METFSTSFDHRASNYAGGMMLSAVFACGLLAVTQERVSVPSREFALSFTSREEKVTYKALWVSRDGGRTWKRAGEAGVSETWGEWADGKVRCAVRVSEDGAYDFYAQVGDEVSNRTSEPQPGQPADPRLRLEVTTVRGALSWEEPRAAATWTPGQKTTLRWSASDPGLAEKSADLQMAVDQGAWTTVARGLDPSGAYVWTVPDRDARLRFRVRAVTRDGGEVSAESPAITVRARGTVAPAAGRGDVLRARELYDRARVLHAQQRTAEAQIKYEEALSAWPDFSEALNDLGKLYHDQKDAARGLEYFLRARKACPCNPVPYVNAARAEVELGLADDALRNLREGIALGLEKDERTSVLAGETLWALARAAVKDQNPSRAREACEMILKLRRAARPTRAKAEQTLEWLKSK